MAIFNSIIALFFNLIVRTLSFTSLLYMILGVFVITACVNIFCYIVWGRY